MHCIRANVRAKITVIAAIMVFLTFFAAEAFVAPQTWRQWSDNQKKLYGWLRILNEDQMFETIQYLRNKYPDYAHYAAFIAKSKKGWEEDCHDLATAEECIAKINASSLVPADVRRESRLASPPSPQNLPTESE